jgi:cysteine-rich repeat protein
VKVAIVVALVASACVQSHEVPCADGTICAQGKACAEVSYGSGTVSECVDPGQLAACDGMDLVSCTFGSATSTCHNGVCLPNACGNDLLDVGEVCDDGNQRSQDGCSGDCLSNETCGNQFLDSSTGEQCDLGSDHVSHDGCSSDCQLETARWAGIQSPGRRDTAYFAYDIARRRAVMFGGTATGPSGSTISLEDTYEWDGARWYAVGAAARPSARAGHAMTYDAAHERIVLFSGQNVSADTWVWSGGDWEAVATTSQPSARDTTLAYDSVRQRVVLFGGELTSGFSNIVVNNETWEFDGSDWVQLTPAASPPARGENALAFDPKRGVTVLYGGNDATFEGDVMADLWEFDGTTWTKATFSGGPGPRALAPMAFDPVTQKVMLVGGLSGIASFRKDAWEWDGTSWTQLPDVPLASGTAVIGQSLVSDPVRGRVILITSDGNTDWNTFEWDGTSWHAGNAVTSASPPARDSAAIAFDDKARQLVMFGGTTNHELSGGGLADTWIWDGAWHTYTGTAPAARFAPMMAYDPMHDSTLLFGGCTGASTALADAWLWKNGAWQSAAAGPTSRCYSGMAFDGAEIVMFGGTTAGQDNGNANAETWTWDGSAWHSAAPAMAPSARYAPAMAYDPVRDQVVLFGGLLLPAVQGDTWIWDHKTQTWSKPAVALSPPARAYASMAWDPARQTLVLYGGFGTQSLDDAWQWDGQRWSALAIAGGPGVRQTYALATSPDGAGILMFGGSTEIPIFASPAVRTGPFADLWRARWDGTTSYESCVDIDVDGDGLTGCADPDCAWACSQCGNGTCEPFESCVGCAADCGACAPRCGDLTCSAGETHASCPADCP